MIKDQRIKSDFAIFALFLLGVFLYLSYLGNSIRTVWELGDEAGYLGNAALFFGADWTSIFETNDFFNFGYSVTLIPAFLLSRTGEQFILFAIRTNILTVMLTFVMVRHLVWKLFHIERMIVTCLIACIVCLNPYVVSNCLKVNCECLCLACTCAVYCLLYRLSQKDDYICVILLGLLSAFMPFVHTRLSVISLPLFFMSFVIFFVDRKTSGVFATVKKFYLAITSFIIPYCILLSHKNNLLEYMESITINKSSGGLTNVVTKDLVSDWVTWILMPENAERYIGALVHKLYSCVVITSGLLGLGLFLVIVFCFREHGAKLKAILISPFILMLVMVVICILTGTGSTLFNLFVYTRYFEFVVLVAFAFTLGFIYRYNVSVFAGGVILVLSYVLGKACTAFLFLFDTDELKYDTNRIPDYSWAISLNNNYYSVLTIEIIIATVIGFVAVLSMHYKSSKLKILVLLMVFFINLKNSGICSDYILRINEEQYPDTVLANEIVSSISDDNRVYMLDDDSYRFVKFYMRMQCLLKDIPMKVIFGQDYTEIPDLRDGDYVIIYNSAPDFKQYYKDGLITLKGSTFSAIRIAQNE